MTVGLYDDGTPGEVFTVMAKEGSVVSGLIDGFSTMTSLALQYGVPLDVMVRKFSHTRVAKLAHHHIKRDSILQG